VLSEVQFFTRLSRERVEAVDSVWFNSHRVDRKTDASLLPRLCGAKWGSIPHKAISCRVNRGDTGGVGDTVGVEAVRVLETAKV
jgi:hypothetical protein